MAAPFASDTSVLSLRWRALTAGEEPVAAALLADAEAVLTARIPDLATRAAEDPNLTPLVQQVQAAMVLRVLRNPDGKRQETIDDYSWTRDNAVSAGMLYVSDDELGLLRVSTRRGLWTQPVTRAEHGTTGWVPVEGAEYPFPWYADASEPGL